MSKLSYYKNQDFALITGASSGIGEEFARKFASMGCNVILVARNKEKLNELAKEIEKNYSVNAEVIQADLSQEKDVDKIEEHINELDNLSVLVNCAGFAIRKQFSEQDYQKQLSMIQVHIIASTRLTRIVIPKMIKNNRGVIINVSSLLSLMTLNSNVVHCATKAYLNKFSKNLQMELKGSNIKVQALNAGFTLTNFHSTEEFKGVEKKYPKIFTMTTDILIDKSIKALKSKRVIVIPGFANKLLVRFRFLFERIIMKKMK